MFPKTHLLQILTVPLFAAPLLALAAPKAPLPAPTYCAIPLGNFTGYDLGKSGEVVGMAETATGDEAAIWKNGRISRYGTLGGYSSRFTAISSNGLLTGSSDVQGNSGVHAFIYQNGIMRDIGAGNSQGLGINSSGQVAGVINQFMSGRQFLYSRGALKDIGTLGGRFSDTGGINEAGIIVGRSETADYKWYAFVYRDGVMSILNAPGWTASHATKINNAGDIIGSFERADQQAHAFLYSRGVMREIDTFGSAYSIAFGINDRHQIVGGYILTEGEHFRAFLYEDGKMWDLNSLVKGLDGRNLEIGSAINNNGQILGYACSDALGCTSVLLDSSKEACKDVR